MFKASGFCLYTLLFYIVALQPTHSAPKIALDFTTLDNFPPFSWRENQKEKGIDIDIFKEVCRRIQMHCSLRFAPWKRVLSSIKSGEKDGGFAAFKTSERESYAHFLDLPIHYSTYNVFVKKGREFPFNNIKDLYGKELGINRGFRLSTMFDSAVSEGKILTQETNNLEASLRKLAIDRVEGVAANYHETLVTLKRMNLSEQIVALPHPIVPPKGSYIIISRAAPIANKSNIIDKMNLALMSMYRDGYIDQINTKYLH